MELNVTNLRIHFSESTKALSQLLGIVFYDGESSETIPLCRVSGEYGRVSDDRIIKKLAGLET